MLYCTVPWGVFYTVFCSIQFYFLELYHVIFQYVKLQYAVVYFALFQYVAVHFALKHDITC